MFDSKGVYPEQRNFSDLLINQKFFFLATGTAKTFLGRNKELRYLYKDENNIIHQTKNNHSVSKYPYRF
jgi:hypothetical protein